MISINYDLYLDKILGGWLGKCIGGTIGARFEGYKGWIDIQAKDMFPEIVPPNDDLDLQILWLKVLEERGSKLCSGDLAQAWLDHCWYPFNEYGIFRRNWRLGIHPPYSGKFGNQFWETGMGCPIRAEIWGYIFPGAPDRAVRYAEMDGCLDHTEQSIGGEKFFAAMASMAFFESDIRRLIDMNIHYLPANTPIERLTKLAIQSYDEGVPLITVRNRIMVSEGLPEACDSQINVPFTILGLLYGNLDLTETILSALRCGYDTDCTVATAAALVGQIRGASCLPLDLKQKIGNDLVMGIFYHRREMTISALARDTARMGVLMAKQYDPVNRIIAGAPNYDVKFLDRLPVNMKIHYSDQIAIKPHEACNIKITFDGIVPEGSKLAITSEGGWSIFPSECSVSHQQVVDVWIGSLAEPQLWNYQNIFNAKLFAPQGDIIGEVNFGIPGAGIWQFLGAYYDAVPGQGDEKQIARKFNHHFVALTTDYLEEPLANPNVFYDKWSQIIGKPAVVYSIENEIDLSQVTKLRGPFCAYLARTIVSKSARQINLVIGNTDPYRIYHNGKKIAEVDETITWTPFNNVHRVDMVEGDNLFIIKMIHSGEHTRLTFALRDYQDGKHQNTLDWLVDFADRIP